jgi:hypothetical protein
VSRYTSANKSAAAISSGTNLFNIIGQSGVHVKARKVVFGLEGATTPSQVSIGLFRATARGTQSTTAAPLAEDSAAPASVTTVDTAWSVQPTLAATPLVRRAFDVLAESEWVLELPDELDTGTGTANGLCAQLLDNALPSGVNLVWTLFEDE